jgi:hypothetical protein
VALVVRLILLVVELLVWVHWVGMRVGDAVGWWVELALYLAGC